MYDINQMNQAGEPSGGLEPVSGSHLVELSVVAPTGQEQIADDMRNFAEQLKPYPSLLTNTVTSDMSLFAIM